MNQASAQRRLAAILVADVVGYSRLMEADETGTLAALRERRKTIVQPLVRENGGRIVKFMGDGVLVEFASAVNAVRCALDLQKKMAGSNEKVADSKRIVLRIGVNIGEVVGDGSDIFGDGVNIAARLEGLAEPGGICISGKLHDEIRGKLDFAAADLGEVTLKNIVKPVRVYSVETDGDRGLRVDPLYLSALASLGPSVPQKLMAVPDKDSIAVLPFLNISADAEQEHFTDGLTEDIITDLSNVPGFFVIARNSTFAYKGIPTDVRQIAHDLGVRYIIEGSARRSDKRLRVNVQLIDAAEGGNHIWAERFDRDLVDIFEVQDEVTRRIVGAITGKLGHGSVFDRYRTPNLEAYDLCVKVRNHFLRSKAAAKEAHLVLERALALDPHFAEAHYELALVHLFLWVHYGEVRDIHQKAALAHAENAVELDPKDPAGHATLGFVLMYDQQWTEAGREMSQSIEMNPNDADSLATIADYSLRIGKYQKGLDYMYRAFRLNPRAPVWYYWTIGELQIELGHFEDAVKALNRPEVRQSVARRVLASALALSGRQQEAEIEAAAFKIDYPDWTISKWSESAAILDPINFNGIIRGYRLAGFPE